jgi:UDP-N-acetylmuramoylalanine--D-glutamate ligase
MKNFFKNKKVLIMGLGLNNGGLGSAKFFAEQGANVLVTDLKREEELEKSLKPLRKFKIRYSLAGHKEEDFKWPDFIIKNPAVPSTSKFLNVAREHNIPIKTDLEIFLDLCGCKTIGITGTKGKSTTATLCYLFLKSKFKDTILAGNIGISPLEMLPKIKKRSIVVLELSSFELEDLKKSPEVSLITNIFPDHLNRYDSFEEYVSSKKRIFQNQKKGDILILNLEDLELRKFLPASSRVYFFSAKSSPEKDKNASFACFLRGGDVFFSKEKKSIFSLNKLKICGEHNIYNILAAASIAKLMKVPSESIKKIAVSFEGVKNRQEFVAEKSGIKFFNDTTATNPGSAAIAIKTFAERFPLSNLILIAGGEDKNLNFKDFAVELEKHVNFLVLLPGSASEKIKNELNSLGKVELSVIPVASIEEAVEKAAAIAKKNDIILLSPAAASFNLFKNEFDRGERFVRAVKKLK